MNKYTVTACGHNCYKNIKYRTGWRVTGELFRLGVEAVNEYLWNGCPKALRLPPAGQRLEGPSQAPHEPSTAPTTLPPTTHHYCPPSAART